jgi:hypothetical protein
MRIIFDAPTFAPEGISQPLGVPDLRIGRDDRI